MLKQLLILCLSLIPLSVSAHTMQDLWFPDDNGKVIHQTKLLDEQGETIGIIQTSYNLLKKPYYRDSTLLLNPKNKIVLAPVKLLTPEEAQEVSQAYLEYLMNK